MEKEIHALKLQKLKKKKIHVFDHKENINTF